MPASISTGSYHVTKKSNNVCAVMAPVMIGLGALAAVGGGVWYLT